MRKRMVTFLVITVALAGVGSGQTRDEPIDSRWTPWLGCWTPAEREVFTEEQQLVRLRPAGDDGGADAQPAVEQSDEEVVTALVTLRRYDQGRKLVCFSPIDHGVEMVTFINSTPVLRTTLVADGVERTLQQSACRGSRASEWSPTSDLLVLRSRLSCDSSGVKAHTGLSFLSSRGWTDIESIQGIDGARDVFVRRYRRASPEAARAVSTNDTYDIYASAPAIQSPEAIGMDELIDVAGKVSPEVVQTAILELGTSIEIRRETISRLDDANVPGSVVDLLVAHAFPNRYRHSAPEASGRLNVSEPLERSTARLRALELDQFALVPFGYAGYGRTDHYDLLRLDTPSFSVRRLSRGERYIVYEEVHRRHRGRRGYRDPDESLVDNSGSTVTGEGGGGGDVGGSGGAYASPDGYHGPPR